MHQIAPSFHFFFRGSMPPDPPNTSVIPHPYRAAYVLSLVNKFIFIKTLMNAEQIYTFLMKLKLNTHIGLIAIVRRLFTVTKNKSFHFVLKIYNKLSLHV